MRSKLFVPGGRPDLFAKAWAGAADAVSFDLEDAVAEERKAGARADIAAFLATHARDRGARLAIVRVNAPGTHHFEADLEAIVPAGPDLINVPKLESAAQVLEVVAALERLDRQGAGGTPPRLLLNIETPRGLRCAAEIAAAHPRVAGLQLGLGDLFETQGIRRDDPANVHAAMFRVAMAAAEAGVFACDGAHPDFRDRAAFEHEARIAQGLGFIGKSCIHPQQIAWAHVVFTPDAAALAWARKVVSAAAEARSQSRAAFAVDGRMVDLPYLRRAERLLAQAGAQLPAAP
ncbi:HpcH/HpaI aldolase/citrate lyase family protein [Luteimonas sp. SDU101]|uniref:HpcH/HpaI aldolase/citrate lyase family protein n=1 Tax=unclassified Luteimonas TaxID=2629088 RepID=UPI003EB89FD0